MANDTLRPEHAEDPVAAVVAVVGAGTMGAGIAQLAAVAGHRTLVLDAAPGAAATAVAGLRERLASLGRRGKLDPDRAARAAARLEAVDDVAALAPAGVVIEAVVEDLAVKQRLLAELEATVAPTALLLTNTSSLSVTALAAPLTHPGRFAGLHFFNPAPVMPLVEVVGGAATAPDVLDALVDLAHRWGRTPVRCADAPGFIVNRVARPFYGEAHRLLEEQAASPATIDAVLREAGGFRMGPLELTDLVGQDVNLAVSTSVWQQTYLDPRYTPSVVQRQLVDGGRLGRKSGRGVYSYPEDEAAATPAADELRPATEPARPAPAFVVADGGFVVNDGLLDRAAAVGVAFRREPQAGPQAEPHAELESESYRGRHAGLLDAGLSGAGAQGDGEADGDELTAPFGGGYLLPSGGRLVETNGETATLLSMAEPHVVVDWVGDPATATRVAVSACDGCPPEVLEEAVGLLQAAGLAVSVVDDVPGLVVARTVAMLVNEAVDLVQRGTASPEDVDTAMRLGTNYPRGPLEWGERLGAAQVVSVLDALHAAVPTGRYRTSGVLRRRALVEDALGDVSDGPALASAPWLLP